MRSLAKLLGIISFGLVAFLVVSFPIVCALIAHFIAKHGAHPHPDFWSLRIGLLSLLLLPLGIAGNALYASLEYARKNEKPTSAPVSPVTKVLLPAIAPFDQKDVMSAWQTSLEVQEHFNDLELQIRNFAITLLVAVMGGTAFTLKEHYNIQFGDQTFSLAVVVLLAGVLGWVAFYFMDRHWYHRLLIGSVMHTISNIEVPYESFAPLGLSRRIGFSSAIMLWKLDPPRNKRTHWIEIHSTEKIDLFYSAGLFLFSLLIAGTLLVPETAEQPPSLLQPQKSTPTHAMSTAPGTVVKSTGLPKSLK
jgi:MFS family permease